MRAIILGACVVSLSAANAEARVAPATIPAPRLLFVGAEHYESQDRQWVRYRFHVTNKARYPSDFFAISPDLPPCGQNVNASRTWVDFYDAEGQRLYGFCALPSPQDLDSIWFALEEGKSPPSTVYIELKDRRAGKSYRSNMARVTVQSPGKPKP